MRWRLIIFDWDGTVVDSADHIASCLHQAAEHVGLPVRPAADYRNIIGLGMVQALNTLYPGISDNDALALRDAYSSSFMASADQANRLFEGMHELLHTLGGRGHDCAIATGKSRRGLDRALQLTGLGPRFSASRCADETRSKPDPAMLRELLAHYRLSADEAVMIGDTRYDMEMAQRINMPAIGVSWGVHSKETLAEHGPLAITESVNELTRTLIG